MGRVEGGDALGSWKRKCEEKGLGGSSDCDLSLVYSLSLVTVLCSCELS